ncbi:MAG: DNA mismatch repair protein MutS [Mailhella sp.]|nr:DNA mismatch repair protein MutS [Mailhella sp.]
MYEQYLSIKKDYPDAVLFYRMGDFYELFFKDAEIASRELQLALTSRSKDDAGVPMCGVPWHACESYFSQMVEKGYTIAICDQVEDPRKAKGLVRREVTRVITPGTALDDMNLEAKSHTFLGAVCRGKESVAFAWADVSTGEWTGFETSKESELWQWVLKIAPREVLTEESLKIPDSVELPKQVKQVRQPGKSYFNYKACEERLLAVQKVADAGVLGLDGKPNLLCACGALVCYLEQTQKTSPTYLNPFRPLELGANMVLDTITESNLELFRTSSGAKGKGTLLHELDGTLTPMGGRLLEERLRYPWKNLKIIRDNQDAVDFFACRRSVRDNLRQALKGIYDMERVSTRIVLNRCTPRDFVSLKEGLRRLPFVRSALAADSGGDIPAEEFPVGLRSLLSAWDPLDDVHALLEKALVDDPPLQITDGMLFRYGYSDELDELLDLIEHGESKLKNLLAAEQERSGFPKLKLGYNRVFGYYFELSKSQRDKAVPDYFIRKQTLANAERYVTPELKELEEKLLAASENRSSLEYRLFRELRDKIAGERPRILLAADLTAQLDVWQGLAEQAEAKAWKRPDVTDDKNLLIKEGRHPVVESFIGRNNFVPNDVTLDPLRRLLIITGPNMAGKSTILRQAALICVMAQIGSFVPASFARIGIVDRIFSRVGASDNLSRGQSTFMVEMTETARILRQATGRSLVILDEIGRGTSTYDGMAIAWAVVEELAVRAQGSIRTLFATHYHELTALDGRLKGVCNMNVAIREWNNEIFFLRKLIPGPADKSYGIEVARLAGVPMPVVQRARDILKKLENERGLSTVRRKDGGFLPGLKKNGPVEVQGEHQEHPVITELRALDPNSLTPFEALKLLGEWKNRWGK